MNGYIKDEDIEEVRERSNLVEVISEYVTLKKAGRTFKGLCPFHQEKTPSFVVDPQKQLYHCFGCGVGGNVYTFIMKMDNVDFPEAVQSLAKRCGYNLRFEQSKGAKQRVSRNTRLYQANEQAANFYHRFLKENKEAQNARHYLAKRGYDKEIVDHFQVGLAPAAWDGLFKFLSKQGFKAAELETAGLVLRSGSGSYYDRFRGRIIFPIFDLKGGVVGFGGRVLGDELPKYLNSPETPIYHKSSVLYNFNFAKDEINKAGCVLVVEGYTDVLSMVKYGIANVVASLGTAFTSSHVHLLARFTNQIKLLFDADSAGKAAAERGLELLGEAKVDISVVSLPQGKDPADFLSLEGKDKLIAYLDKATPLIDFCLKQVTSKYNLADSQGRVKASYEALPIVAALPSAIAQEDYLKKLASILNTSADALLIELKKAKQSSKQKYYSKEESRVPKTLTRRDVQTSAERELIKLILLHPQVRKKAYDMLEPAYFTNSECKELFLVLKTYLKENETLEVADFVSNISNQELQSVLSELALEGILAEDKNKYFEEITRRLKEFNITRQISNLKVELDSLDSNKSSQKHDELFKQLLHLEEVKRALSI